VQLVDGVGADDLGVAQREELRAANIESIEAGNACAGYGARIGVVKVVIVHKVVSGDLAHSFVGIDAHGTLVVADGL
jgi:hypothetical protein